MTARPVLLLLFATGWAANHFSGVVPALRADGVSDLALAQVFGLYAVGLLPGLLTGGGLSDRRGRAGVVLPGAAVVLAGTALLAVWHTAPGLGAGRIVVGLGAGAVFSAGTAWVADLLGARGAALAGVVLTSGFAVGPFVSGALAQVAPGPTVVPFAVSGALSLAAALGVVRAARARTEEAAPTARPEPVAPRTVPSGPDSERSAGRALVRILPMGPLVFGSATVGLFTVPTRLGGPGAVEGPFAAGVAALAVLGVGLLAQVAVRRTGRSAGTLGALCGAAGLALLGASGSPAPPALLALCTGLLGLCYGLVLHAGLVDVDRFAPPGRRGALVGVWYVATYVGFSVPTLLALGEARLGPHEPLLIGAAVALTAALARVVAVRATERSGT